jgi:hypothetical protein
MLTISVYPDNEHGPSILLNDYEHLDYIDDVLTEHVDILCDFQIVDDDNQKYALCFGAKISFEELPLIVVKFIKQ